MEMNAPDEPGRPAPTRARSEPVMGFRMGDFLLSKAHGLNHRLIKFGQTVRTPGGDRRYAEYTHTALVVSDAPDVQLIESVGAGLHQIELVEYVEQHEEYQIVRVAASDADREQIVAFARRALARKKKYDHLANVSTAVWAFTGTRLTFFLDGAYTCSGLVTEALKRMGSEFDENPARVMPAQLASFFGAALPPPDPPGIRPWLPAGARRR